MSKSMERFRECNRELRNTLNNIKFTHRDVNETSQLLDIMYDYGVQLDTITVIENHKFNTVNINTNNKTIERDN